MNKYYGNIGFYEQVEDVPGVFNEHILERPYYGDVIREHRIYRVNDKVNPNVDVNHSISIVMDPYAYSNYKHIRYVEWEGNKWQVSSIDIQYPRLILSIGGEYVEQETSTP